MAEALVAAVTGAQLASEEELITHLTRLYTAAVAMDVGGRRR